MSRMIMLLSVVIVLFGVAAGASWYLQSQHAKDANPHAADEKSPKTTEQARHGKQSAGETSPNRPVIRPAATSNNEQLTQLAATLQQQQETLKTRENEIGVREKQMDILHGEIKKEQKKLDATRKEIQSDLQLVQEKLELLEKRSLDGVIERKGVDAQKRELERTILEVESQEWNNLKQQVKTFDKMDPEAAANMIVNMVDQGKLDTAVKVLSQLRDRQSAAIFAEIGRQDTKLPGQLLERILAIKPPTVTAPK